MNKTLAVAGLLAVAACGSPASAHPKAPAAAAQTQSQTPGRQGGPGVSGLLAALTGHTLQVQSETAQTAVTYSAATRFSDTVKASLAQVQVGSCVMVRSAAGSGTPDATPPTAVTAVSVEVTAPVDGACTGGFAARGRFGGGPRPSGAPDGFRGTPPSGFPRAGRFGGGGAFGKVTSTSGSGFVVATVRPGDAGTTTTTPVTVTTTAATTYTAATKATAAALKVGECVTARGQADSTGTVAATAISIRPATNGSCTVTAGGPVG